MSNGDARSAVLATLKGAPSAVAVIVVVVLFLRQMDITETRTIAALDRITAQVEALSREFVTRNQMAAEAIRDIARNTDQISKNTEAISKVAIVLDGLVARIGK